MLLTKRLCLRPFLASDVPSLFEFMGDSAAMQYTHVDPSCTSLHGRLNEHESQRARRGFAPWVILERKSGDIIGWGGLYVDPVAPAWGIEVGYAFTPGAWGKGFASELVQFALWYAFDVLKVPEVCAFAMPQNLASVRVLTKSGFELTEYVPALGRHRYTVSAERAKSYSPGECVNIALESANQPEVLRLIEALDAYQKPLYPAESHHGIDIGALSKSNVLFAVARQPGAGAIACGAAVMQGDVAELKRMYTAPAQRGHGIARHLLAFLEVELIARKCSRIVLETGNLQPEAIALYERCGYAHCGPFGDYLDDPHSVFMKKTLPLQAE
ncbi:GNAT family N-acetyltransferase [Pandoraea anhela]|nr:GNAT family N-acetyltransferase [Pandoraea anhela]